MTDTPNPMLGRKAETLANLADEYLTLVQRRDFTEALGLIRVMARLRIELEALTEAAAYQDNTHKDAR